MAPRHAYYLAVSPVDGDLYISYGTTHQIYRIQSSLLNGDEQIIRFEDIGNKPGIGFTSNATWKTNYSISSLLLFLSQVLPYSLVREKNATDGKPCAAMEVLLYPRG